MMAAAAFATPRPSAAATAATSGQPVNPPPAVVITPAKAAELRVQGTVLIHALVKHVDLPPSSRRCDGEARGAAARERKQRLAQEEHTALEQLGESKLLVKCFPW